MKTSKASLIAVLLLTPAFGTAFAIAQDSKPITGRYVHVSLPHRPILSLAEVQVFSSGTNAALNRATRQTSTSHNAPSARAVDGRTSGKWQDGTTTHTAEWDNDPQWEVDLGSEMPVERISLWNRDGLESRLDNATVLVLSTDRIPAWGTSITKAGRGEIVLNTDKPGTLAKLPAKVEPVSEHSSPPPTAAAQPYKSSDYSVSPEDNGGVLNGPLLTRKVPEPKDPLLTLRLAIEDLIATFGEKYPDGKKYLSQLAEIKSVDDPRFALLKRDALLANPLIDFAQVLLVKRKGTGMPQNWQGNSSLARKGRLFENELMVMSVTSGELATVYRPSASNYVGEFDLHYDAGRLLFSSRTDQGNWTVCELRIDPDNGRMIEGSLRQVSPEMGRDIDSYDPVYLPNEKVIFVCSSSYSGVPCVGGGDYVGNLHIMDPDGSNVRQLTFEQDNDWNPVVMDNGRVMYLRWEYTDSAHYYSRVMMYMNQDGTDQKAFYGSNSYWPNSMFFPRPIPGSSSKFVAIVGSHHGAARSGALVLFDAARGRHEADGALQVIGESGQPVEPVVQDDLARLYSPHYLTPFPLSDKYFLASVNINGWKICLVDAFDNVLVLKEEPGWCLLEPVPLRKRERPPVMASRIRHGMKDATIWLSDAHFGPGLEGVPKGTAKALRLYRYEYAPRNAGGHYAMGMETCWDARTILGTVPLEEDGSVMVKVPANTPISVQPLDSEGKALQVMRSWMAAQPGETLSCIGCHESPNSTPPAKPALAARKPPQELIPWYGEARGFSFAREVQPVLDRLCVGCHSPGAATNQPVASLIRQSTGRVGTGPDTGKLFRDAGIPDLSTPESSHANLHPYVRRNGPEGDYHLLTPLEFHADTSELVQLLEKGHHNVKLDKEAWDRLITWMDLNAPFHGTWTEARANTNIIARRLELRAKYAGVDFDPEKIINPYTNNVSAVMPTPLPASASASKLAGWPMTHEEAVRLQGKAEPISLDLGDSVNMALVRIPAGRFLMGSGSETPLEAPVSAVEISRPFWMGTTEVTLDQYRKFDPGYLNGVYDMHYKDQVHRGYYMNNMKFPVIRVSWENANAFCQWLSEKSGRKVSLPTEAQWEWACRAGSADSFSYGGLDTDFSNYANLADVTRRELAVRGVNPQPIPNPPPSVDFELKDSRFYDKSLHLAPVGTYQANAWGLFDMHGNVAEWTSSPYVPYPYGETAAQAGAKRVVRGGSFNDRPCRSTSSYRLGYKPWQRVFNVGFRVIIEE